MLTCFDSDWCLAHVDCFSFLAGVGHPEVWIW
jgi:hypothetical protein